MTAKPDACDPAEIAALVRARDRSAIARIAHCYLDDLLGVGRCACRDPSGAADAVNDALLSALEHLDQFRGDGSVVAWLSRMVVNACRCNERGRKNDPRWNQPLSEAPPGHATSTPREDAATRELARRLREAVESLEPDDQRLLLLSQVGDVSGPELAELLDISPAAVRARLTRLRRRLRGKLEDVWEDWR